VCRTLPAGPCPSAETTAKGRVRAGSILAAALLCLGFAPVARAVVHLGKAEALREAFPGADRVEPKRLFLTDEQSKRIEEIARAKLESKLVTVHVGYERDAVLGYAFLETHNVRTQPETLLIVLSPEGKLERLLVAAFYEPPEYEAPKRWLEQFQGKALGPDLTVNQGIHGIAGATLTARAVTSAVRRAMAVFEVAVLPEKE
jgi:Na+-translocating ferredoxin:NAD+ oxidoreductase RnfG subunit